MKLSATERPYRKPLHAALRSKAPASFAPSFLWRIEAVEGMGISPLIVATITISISLGFTPDACNAFFDASKHKSELVSHGFTILRSLMPVLSVIHSSDVSTFFSKSKLLRTISGT